MRVLGPLVVAFAIGCAFPPLDLDGLACPCGPGWTCIDGSCRRDGEGPDAPSTDAPLPSDTGCSAGLADCNRDSVCETVLSTSTSCGTGCDDLVDCTAFPNVSTVGCSEDGICVIGACESGWADCLTGDGGGCETRIWRDEACRSGCTAPAIDCTDRPFVVEGTCSGGACAFHCETGRVDRDGDPINGCEGTL